MMTNQRHLSMLFSRLTWPSPLARERASTAIARLLLNRVHAADVRAFFLRWLKSQYHESVCGIALLTLLRAKMEGGQTCPIEPEDVRGSLPWPSLQSSILLSEYELKAPAQEGLDAWHSGDPPQTFIAQPFFSEFVRSFLPPIYATWANEIEGRMLIPFNRQWAYEWQVVLNRRRFSLSTSPLTFWLGHREADDRFVAVDTPVGEVYRSAYLRAIAWAVQTRRMDRNVADVMAADTIPVDLELWPLDPSPRPAWWPTSAMNVSPLDTVPGDVWPAVHELWHRQQAGSAPWGADWVLARADGRVRSGNTLYDLSVHSCFQQRLDADDPDVGDVFEWCTRSEAVRLSPIRRSYVRFAGRIRPERVSDFPTQFGGWSVVPAVGRFEPGGNVARWQWWRGYRGMWGPAADVIPDGYTFYRDGNSLAFESGGAVIARWTDWTDELRERLADSTLPATGQSLLIRREVFERFSTTRQLGICWLARLTAFVRERSYEPYQPFHDYRVYGASRIVVPC